MPTTSMQSSAGPGGYCPSGYEDGSQLVADHLHGVMTLWVQSLEWPALLHGDARLPMEFRRQIELQRQAIQIAANLKFNTCL